MPQTPSPLNRMAGIVMMKDYFSMGSRSRAINQPTHIGKDIYRQPILSSHLDLLVAANSLKSQQADLMTRGSMVKTCMASTMTFYTSCQTTSQELCRSALHRILLPAKWLVWLSMACLTPRIAFNLSWRYVLYSTAGNFS
jgi:hypothetical protein